MSDRWHWRFRWGPETKENRQGGRKPAHTREESGYVESEDTVDGKAAQCAIKITTTSAAHERRGIRARTMLRLGHRGWTRAQKESGEGDGAEWTGNMWSSTSRTVSRSWICSCAPTPVELAAKLDQRSPASIAGDDGKNTWTTAGSKAWCLSALLATSIQRGRRRSAPKPIISTRLRRCMRYPAFRRQKLLCRTGVIEAGCKTLIGTSDQTVRDVLGPVRGANAIIALRCCPAQWKVRGLWEGPPSLQSHLYVAPRRFMVLMQAMKINSINSPGDALLRFLSRTHVRADSKHDWRINVSILKVSI